MVSISYKCPNCGGDLRFHPEKQNYKCEFCDSQFSQEQLDALEPEGDPAPAAAPADQAQSGEETEEASIYICPSCGAQIVTEPTTTATFCYYCHNPVVLSGKLEGSYHPDKIIPFAIDRKQALDIFGQWIGKKKYVPRDFYSQEQIEKLTGVYFPYWLYDCQVQGDLDADANKVNSWISGNLRFMKTEEYDVSRSGQMEVRDVPRNALSKANRKLVEGVFPFDMTKQQEFHMGYLSGFMAENRDMDQSQFVRQVEDEVTDYAKQSLTSHLSGYSSVQIHSCETKLEKPVWKYALLPVWTLTYQDKKSGKIYYFACNGQSGKVCGELPVDRGRLGRLFASVFVPVAAALLTVGYFLG